MIANDKNCWGNIQEAAEPWKLSFDVTLPRFWMPLLGPAHTFDLATVQPESIVYEPLSRTDTEAVSAVACVVVAGWVGGSLRRVSVVHHLTRPWAVGCFVPSQLEFEICEKVKKKIRGWRSARCSVQFHGSVALKARELLVELEQHAAGAIEHIPDIGAIHLQARARARAPAMLPRAVPSYRGLCVHARAETASIGYAVQADGVHH